MHNSTEPNNIVKFDGNEPTIWNGKTDANLAPEIKDRDEFIIDDNIKVIVELFCQYDVYFYDITLIKNNEEKFLGRYLKDNKLRVAYNDNKLLIYYGLYNDETAKFDRVIKVINLYNVEDDMFYSVAEEEALKLFNPNWTHEELLNPDGRLAVYTENNKQDKTKNLIRFSYYGD